MRKIIPVVIIIVFYIIFIAKYALCAQGGNLYDMFSTSACVKVYVLMPADSTLEKKINTQDLKKEIESALTNRKSVKFQVLDSKEKADIIIFCDVKKYYWLETDPIDMLLGTGAVAYDAMTSENYAYMEAAFTVNKAKNNKKLWSKLLKIDLTKKDMPKDQAITKINTAAAKLFMREAFSKKRSKQ